MLPAPATPEVTLALHPSTAPKLAIIVPYFKKAFFGELLSNLARQTDKRFTLYIANDNSPEDPRDLIDEFSSDIAVRYHRFPNRLGDRDLAAQWNRCLKLVRGEDWIWILPDDDLPSENCVAEFYRVLEQSRTASINVFHLSLAILDSRGNHHVFQGDAPERESNLSFYERHLRGAGGGSTLGNAIYRASKLLADGGFVSFPKGWGSDHATLLRVASAGEIYHLPKASLTFRMSDTNVSSVRSDAAEKMRSRLEFFEWLKENEHIFPRPPDSDFYKNFYFKGEHYFLYEWNFSISAFLTLWRLRSRCVHRSDALSMLWLLLRRTRSAIPAGPTPATP